MFILFGAFLVRSGVGDYIINVARAAAGKIIGGPGFIETDANIKVKRKHALHYEYSTPLSSDDWGIS